MSRVGSGPDGMPPEDLYRGPSPSQSVQSAIQSPSSGSGTGRLDGLLPGASVMWNILSYFHGQKKADERLAKQREWQLEDWRRMTEYNSPAAVVSRMRSAGLNPDLLVGGNGASSNASMPSQGSVPSGPQAHPLSVIDAIAQAREQARLQNELVESQIHLNEAEADSKRGMLRNDTYRVLIEDALRNSKVKLDNAQVSMLNKQVEVFGAEISKLSAETALTNLQHNWFGKEKTAQLHLIRAQIDNLDSQSLLNDKQKDLLAQQLKELVDTWDVRKGQINTEAIVQGATNVFAIKAADFFKGGSLGSKGLGIASLIFNTLLHGFGLTFPIR